MLVRPYLRASSATEKADCARTALEQFIAAHELTVGGWYEESESGATLHRPELFRLIRDSNKGDVILLEQVDRLSRLTTADWTILKKELAAKQIRVVALDLPTSLVLLNVQPAANGIDFTTQMLSAINEMMLDMLSVISRKAYEDRRRRQSQGIAKAMADKRYKGRPANDERNEAILKQLEMGSSWSEICKLTGCSRSTLSRLNKTRTKN